MYINFSDLPAQPNLFLDYLQEFDNVKKFYGKNFRDVEKYFELFEKLTGFDRPQRTAVADIIKQQYSGFRPSKPTQSNLEALYSPKTVAVVTGQQLGLYGGPLYTIYKIITAIKLANYLKEKYDDYHFVPAFWMEGDDHDFDEVRSLSILGKENQAVTLSYDDGLEEETNRGPVSRIKFNGNIAALNEAVKENLRPSEFSEPLLEMAASCYAEGKTFARSFRELMFSLFDEYGLVIFDPTDENIKRLLIPVFSKEITGYMNHTGRLVERSAELEEIYHAQVKVKPVNLFFTEDKERLLIEPLEEEFRLKGKRKKFTQDELLAQLNEYPGKFSPNVLLRPICQDYLLPTGFYIGGPSEISYFAQITPLYDVFGLNQPFIYPRSSATIVEKGIKDIFQKFELAYQEIFVDEDEIAQRIISNISEVNLDLMFDITLKEFSSTMHQLKLGLENLDKTLGDVSDKTYQKIEQLMGQLKGKASEAGKRRHETTLRQLSKARNAIYPNGNLQERELNFVYFVNKYGMDIIKWIFNELAVNKFEHQILEL